MNELRELPAELRRAGKHIDTKRYSAHNHHMTEFTCVDCGQSKPLSSFHKNASAKRGHQIRCKPCAYALGRRWAEVNRDRVREMNRQTMARARLRNPTYERDRSRAERIRNPKGTAYRRVKTRAKRQGIEFSITMADLPWPERCPVFGHPLVVGGERTENSPSIDRIDNSKGYVPGNVVVVSWKANRIKNDGTLDDLKKIVAFYEGL